MEGEAEDRQNHEGDGLDANHPHEEQRVAALVGLAGLDRVERRRPHEVRIEQVVPQRGPRAVDAVGRAHQQRPDVLHVKGVVDHHQRDHEHRPRVQRHRAKLDEVPALRQIEVPRVVAPLDAVELAHFLLVAEARASWQGLRPLGAAQVGRGESFAFEVGKHGGAEAGARALVGVGRPPRLQIDERARLGAHLEGSGDGGVNMRRVKMCGA